MSLDDVMVANIDWKAKNKQSMSDDTMVDANVLSHLQVLKKLSIAQKVSFWRQARPVLGSWVVFKGPPKLE